MSPELLLVARITEPCRVPLQSWAKEVVLAAPADKAVNIRSWIAENRFDQQEGLPALFQLMAAANQLGMSLGESCPRRGFNAENPALFHIRTQSLTLIYETRLVCTRFSGKCETSITQFTQECPS